ncbi:MAG: hypothetical protein ACR2IF_03380 [Terriglobales bacterium]
MLRQCGIRVALVMAMLAATLAGATPASGQAQDPLEPLQINVPYRCADGTTYTITACNPWKNTQVCTWREEKNGQLIVEANSVRTQMYGRLRPCPPQKPNTSQAAQSGPLNPAYLAELPSPDGVMKEIQGSDATDTLNRQMGAMWQFKRMIEDAAGPRKFRGLTPDEGRLIGVYSYAYDRLSKMPGAPRLSDFDVDPRFRAELWDRFHMNQIRAQIQQSDAVFAERHQQRLQAEQQQMQAAQARQKAAMEEQQAKDEDSKRVQRCIASGRSAWDCTGEALKKGMGDMMGVVDPSFKKAFTSEPGLRLSGIWKIADFTLIFPSDSDLFSIGCCGFDLGPNGPYTIVNTGSQLEIRLATLPKPITFVLKNGHLVGPGRVPLTGKIQTGVQNYVRTYTDGHTERYSVPVYSDRTSNANAGDLPFTGAAPGIGVGQLAKLGMFHDTEKAVTGSKDFKEPPGLRLIGNFGGPSGFTAEFNRKSVVVGCGDAAVAQNYTIHSNGGQVAVNVENGSQPIVLTIHPDMTISGPGQVQVSGRSLVGMKHTDDNSQLVFKPVSAACNVGNLTLVHEGPSEAERGAAAARASIPGPIMANGQSAAFRSDGSLVSSPSGVPASAPAPAGPASALISLAAFTVQAGGPSPLAGHHMVLLHQSFADILARYGFSPPPGKTIFQAWADSCSRREPRCQQALAAITPGNAGVATISPDGKASFPAVPQGTYFIFGSMKLKDHGLLWDVKIDAKPGSQTVALEPRNAVSVN